MSDDRARLVHLLEQAEGILADLAPSLGRYYARLVDAGIPPEQAILLVRDVQRRYLGDADDE